MDLQALSVVQWSLLVCAVLIFGIFAIFLAIPYALAVVKSELRKFRLRRAYYAQVKCDLRARQAAEAARSRTGAK